MLLYRWHRGNQVFMLKISLISITTVVIIASMLFSFQAGIFDSVCFFEETRGPYFLVYKEYKGSYSAVGYRIKDVYQKVKSEKKTDSIKGGFAIFYDNPKDIKSDSLRSICGVFTDSLINVDPPYKTTIYKKTKCIVGKFPLRSFFSYMTGLYKFYPALEKYSKNKSLITAAPVMELIDTKSRSIIYIVSADKKSSVPHFGK